MTGLSVRIVIDARAVSIDVDQLPDPQLEEWAAGRDEAAARRWLVALCRWIRDEVAVSYRGETDEAIYYVAALVGIPGEAFDAEGLSDDALKRWSETVSEADARGSCVTLCRWIRENVEEAAESADDTRRKPTGKTGKGG